MSCGCDPASCGCCEGVQAVTPADTYNPPGRSSISHRIGTHGAFFESLQARLSSQPALANLTTRELDDPAIALLDCFAVLGDVLTFYQERLANEGYLRTASESLSLNELAALVGYRPRPALGSSTVLAFTLDPGARTVIPGGSGARSVPKQNELPQTFETSDDLAARQEWNTLQPAMTAPLAINAADDAQTIAALTVAGTTANLKAGDRLLFLLEDPAKVDPKNAVVRIVSEARPDFSAGTTAVSLVSPTDVLTTARTALQNAVTAARATVPAAGSSPEVDNTYLQPLQDKVLSLTVAQILQDLPDLVDRLTESGALAAVQDPAAVVSWYDTEIATVIDAARDAIHVAETIARQAPSEILSTRRLAQQTLCPHGPSRDAESGDCDAGDALIGLTPMLPWLRRPPSQLPRKPRDAVGTVAELFRPDAGVHTRLLAAADPRLADILQTAWAHQQLTAPPGLSALQVMRTRASVVGNADTPVVQLDTVYDGIQSGSWVVLDAQQVPGVPETSEPQVRRVTSAILRQRTETIGTTQVQIPATQLTLDSKVVALDGTPVYGQGENITVVGDPVTDDIGGGEIELDRVYDGLAPGRWIVVAGERTDVPFTTGVHAAELAMVAGVRQRLNPDQRGSSVRTFLDLTGELSYRYRRDTVTVYGNVIDATQGETRRQPLGGGDAGAANQAFAIRQTNADYPLTVLPADNPAGALDTLQVAVSGVRWTETEILATASGADHVYSATVAADKSVTVQFGDGVHGARPQTGTDNIAATLRVGAGPGGNVAADQISQLASRPLGVSAVTNPIPATGGADGDGPADLRASAPLRILALDRLVSVSDYADFTRARGGIGKASAAKLFDGRRHVVHVTIAGIGDAPIDPGSGLATALQAALTDFGDVGLPVEIAERELVLLVLSAGIRVIADHSWDDVEPAVRAAVLGTFSFAKRSLAQDAYLSEAVAAIQAVPGVDYVDVDVFHGIPQTAMPVDLITLGAVSGPDRVVPAEAAQFVEERVAALSGETLSGFALRVGLTVAQLCLLNPQLGGIELTTGQELVVRRGIRPAQIALVPSGVPEALTLRRIS